MTFSPHEVENAPAVLAWKDLVVKSTKHKDKSLLNKVSGRIAGGFVAVMGPSGSGKSTLLNALACRLTRGMFIAGGELRLNGRLYSQRDLKMMSGYVMQDDLMNGALTVQGTLCACCALDCLVLSWSSSAGSLAELTDATLGSPHTTNAPPHRQQRRSTTRGSCGCRGR